MSKYAQASRFVEVKHVQNREGSHEQEEAAIPDQDHKAFLKCPNEPTLIKARSRSNDCERELEKAGIAD